MCRTHNHRLDGLTVDTAGRVIERDYERRPTRCEKCGQRRVQVHGRWCCECWSAMLADVRIDWTQLTRAQFEQYARER